MRIGFFIYLAVGLLVAGGVVGSEPSYFSNLDSIEEIVEMLIAVLLWPLILLDVNLDIGNGGPSDGGSGGGGSDPPGSGTGGK